MGASLDQVTLVGPLRGERWVSIERYAQAILGLAGQRGLQIRGAPTLADERFTRRAGYVARYRRLPELLRNAPTGEGLVHIVDQALGHLVDCFPGRPVVVTCHDLMPLTMEGHYRGAFEGWLDRRLLRRSLAGMLRTTRIIAVSEHTASECETELGVDRGRVSVVPNMPTPHYARHEDAEEWLEARGIVLPARPRVLSVGHSRPYKNLELLLKAMGHGGLREASLVRAGAPLTPHQRTLARDSGLSDRLVQLGHLEPPVLARVYAACDVLAQPSRSEGFGVPVIEAMACGLPVVCSDGGALKEVAGDAAMVVPLEGGQEALAEALGRVLRDGELASMLKRDGLARAEAFRPSAVLPLLLAAYRTAFEEHTA